MGADLSAEAVVAGGAEVRARDVPRPVAGPVRFPPA